MTASRLSRIRARGAWLLVVAIGVAVLVAISLANSGPSQDLDPDSAGPSGGKALVQALRHHGVDVQVVRSAQALADAAPAPGVTVVLANPEYLGYDSAVRMRATAAHADRLVLLSPSSDQLTALGLELVSAPAPPSDGSAGCTSPIARADDTVSESDVRFARPDSARGPAAQLCFVLSDPSRHGTTRPDPTFGALMATQPATSDQPEVVALGFASAFTNRYVTQASHAGLAVRALGHSPACSGTSPASTTSSMPPGARRPRPGPPGWPRARRCSRSRSSFSPSCAGAGWARSSPNRCRSSSAPWRPPRAVVASTAGPATVAARPPSSARRPPGGSPVGSRCPQGTWRMSCARPPPPPVCR
ncbi:DUF4350 domain-containing protein [Nostocoides sp. HKS02]|uniref:DUF4350 domain-containing protein n=1 Tax=Nostocoides sp. HKS02 TaxID=1813880 RepID=UPI0012B49A8D|nr:DUF4350 domain-containing protein [Tetrasphaera sp. HKS02]QGN56617.1 DUF4350 domain-containing protein [Tetrasphaera sp. HKS02]